MTLLLILSVPRIINSNASSSTGTTILTPQYSVEIRWVLGSDSLDEVDPEDNLLEKNNNDTQDTLDRIPSCVRFEF